MAIERADTPARELTRAGRSRRPRPRVRFDQRILLLALSAGLPAAIVALILLWTGDYTPKVQWTLTTFLGLWWLGYAFHLRNRVVMPLQTLSNLQAALREGDFSIRARGARRGDALGDDPRGHPADGVARHLQQWGGVRKA